mgnify:FL=1
MLGPAATAAAAAAELLPPVGAFSQLMHLSEIRSEGGVVDGNTGTSNSWWCGAY